MSAIPKKTQQNIVLAERTWFSWATQQVENMSTKQSREWTCTVLEGTFSRMRVEAMNYWLCLEARAMSDNQQTNFIIRLYSI